MQLPQLGGMTFSITTTGGWYDKLQFLAPGSATVPLDISGINFHAELRTAVGDASNKLDISSSVVHPQFIVGGTNGTLFFSVDASLLINLTPGVYVMDILAIDITSGMIRNLCEGGPIHVTVLEGVTR
jgi:hypothetical protein